MINYQRHQGDKFKESYDLSCYLTMLNVLNSRHLDRQRDDVNKVLQSLSTEVLTMGFTDDLLYPDDQIRTAGERFKYHHHFFIPGNVGYDGFLPNFNDQAPNLYYFLKIPKFKRR